MLNVLEIIVKFICQYANRYVIARRNGGTMKQSPVEKGKTITRRLLRDFDALRLNPHNDGRLRCLQDFTQHFIQCQSPARVPCLIEHDFINLSLAEREIFIYLHLIDRLDDLLFRFRLILQCLDLSEKRAEQASGNDWFFVNGGKGGETSNAKHVPVI